MWALGALVGSLITLAGVGFVAAWAAGALCASPGFGINRTRT